MTARQGKGARFSMDLVPTDEASFLSKAVAPPPRAKGLRRADDLQSKATPPAQCEAHHRYRSRPRGRRSGSAQWRSAGKGRRAGCCRPIAPRARGDRSLRRAHDAHDGRIRIARSAAGHLAREIGEPVRFGSRRQRGRGRHRRCRARGSGLHAVGGGLESPGAAPGGKGELRRCAGRR